MSNFKPRSNQPQRTENSEQKEFVPIVPEDGLQVVHVGMLVDLGKHRKTPKFATTNGKRDKDEDGNDKIIWPKDGDKGIEQKVAVYIDLLTQQHDYEGDIGVRNIRLPLHPVSRGMTDGLNFTTVAPRDPDGNYIKGKPWSLAPASQWKKIADATKQDKIFEADYKNKDHNNIGLLLGKPFMANVEVAKTEKDGKTFVNTKIKSPVPLMKGMAVPDALQASVSVNFNDDDLLEVKDELGGIAKIDLLRIADIRKIVLAEDYEGSNMQAAIRERFDESEVVAKAKEIYEKIIETDRDLIEIRKLYPNGQPTNGEAPVEQKEAPKAAKPKKPERPSSAHGQGDDNEDAPF
jgi:hypothetical protein